MELLEREQSSELLRGCPPGRVVLVSGEAGVGKTSLLRAFCAEKNQPAVWGYCDALRTPRPLGPIQDIFRAVGGKLAGIAAAESSRSIMFHAFLEFLHDYEGVVVIEDAHWADEATIDALQFVTRRIFEARCTLVVTYRTDEVDASHPLQSMLGNLATSREVQRIRLLPLTADAVAKLAESYSLDYQELYVRTGGNPFFLSEVLADPENRVPATVRDAVLARAVKLKPEERDVLNGVAIFPGHALLPLIHADPDAVDSCVRIGMLTRDGMRLRFPRRLLPKHGIWQPETALLNILGRWRPGAQSLPRSPATLWKKWSAIPTKSP
jgi:hypothetical protein